MRKKGILVFLMAAVLWTGCALPEELSVGVNLNSTPVFTEMGVDWIDRLDLSGEAVIFRDLYETLVEASDNDGEEDYLIEDKYFNGENVIPVAIVTGTLAGGETPQSVLHNISDIYGVYIQAVRDAFERDHPEVFWLDDSLRSRYSISLRGSSYIATIDIVLQGIIDGTSIDIRAAKYRSETAITDAIDMVEKNADAIVGAVLRCPTHEKLKYFNEILTTRNEYNTSTDLGAIAYDCRECTAALIGSTGEGGPVCESYSKAFKVLCDKAGIRCVLVDGTVDGTVDEAHMWNYVQVDGSWYAVDVTWNDPKVVNGKKSGAISGLERETYFLIGSETVIYDEDFGTSRTIENQVSQSGLKFTNQPVLSAIAYDPLLDE